jgi:putative phosphoribosyl transferase
MLFVDRADAGRQLGQRLRYLRSENAVVLGLPRGGVPVAYEVARALDAPLDVIVVRKLGVPFQPELGMGAIGEGGVRIINQRVVRMARVSQQELAAVEQRERAELERRARRFRSGRDRIPLAGRTAIVVDDGIATGSTAKAACQVARVQGAARVVLAAPVGSAEAVARLRREAADEVICLHTSEAFYAIGEWYIDFSQTPDEEVVALLAPDVAPSGAAPEGENGTVPSDPPGRDEEVQIRLGPVRLGGHLTVPEGASGVVLFVHGSGSSRHSQRNRFVATVLNQAGLGTLLFDLLTPEEEHDRSNVFDIELLTRRLLDTTAWLCRQPEARDARIGYFGASTGAAAALRAAAEPHTHISAVVSRGGRPDLAGSSLDQVTAPTLLLVGGQDEPVLDLNRQALARLRCDNRLTIVPGATHLFSEPGTLEAVAGFARDWFVRHLTAEPRPAG